MPLSRRAFLASALPARRPNVVFLIADDLGWNDVGWNNPGVRTPQLDRLAATGVLLTQYHTNSVCSPTRASLHTGRTAFRVGVPSPVPRGEALPLAEKLLPEYLAEAGYQTWLVGKWHLGEFAPAYWPHRRGYQHHYGFLGGMIDYYEHTANNRPDWYRNGEPVEEEGYSTDLLAQEAIQLIRQRDRARPFFLNLSFNAPHTPLQAPESFVANQTGAPNANRRTFLGMVEAMDAAVGRVFAALESEGIAGDTVIVFVSDNGGQTGMGGGNNGGLRGAKSSAFEGGLRVPAFVRWPGGLEGGWVFDRMFSVMDWLPTLAAVTGFTPDAAIELDGVNLWPYLRDGEQVERGPVILGGGQNVAVFADGWKLVHQVMPNGQTAQFLFRIGEDPLEENDAANGNPAVVRELRAILDARAVGQPDRAP